MLLSTADSRTFPPEAGFIRHLNAPDQQTAKNSACLCTLADNQLIRVLISSAWLELTLLIPVEAVRVDFFTASVFCLSFC